jgi:hypothetical protein
MRRDIVWAMATVLLCWSPLRAADNLVAGTTVGIRPEKVLRAVFRTTGGFPFPSSPTDATLQVFDTALPSAGNVTYSFRDELWQGLGSPPGSAGWRWSRPTLAYTDLCRLILIKPTVIKVLCSRPLNSIPPVPAIYPPFSGDVGLILTVGDQRYCAQFGGVTAVNNASGLRRRNAPAPASCPVPP